MSGLSQTIQQFVRAWVKFNGTGTPAIVAQSNVSSITDNGIGLYTLNFTNAMPDANYAVLGTMGNADGGGAAVSLVPSDTSLPTTTACRVVGAVGTAGNADRTQCSVTIVR